jgi:FlaA1/EpsC-like NDP-sugar epimerase
MERRSKRSAWIYGAGTAGERTLKYYSRTFHVSAFVDRDEAKAGQQLKGIEIILPSRDEAPIDLILVATHAVDEVINFYKGTKMEEKLYIVPNTIREGRYKKSMLIALFIFIYLIATLALSVLFIIRIF